MIYRKTRVDDSYVTTKNQLWFYSQDMQNSKPKTTKIIDHSNKTVKVEQPYQHGFNDFFSSSVKICWDHDTATDDKQSHKNYINPVRNSIQVPKCNSQQNSPERCSTRVWTLGTVQFHSLNLQKLSNLVEYLRIRFGNLYRRSILGLSWFGLWSLNLWKPIDWNWERTLEKSAVQSITWSFEHGQVACTWASSSAKHRVTTSYHWDRLDRDWFHLKCIDSN